MKFVAVSYGTDGDTRPVATLCRGLIDAGHSVRMLADASTVPFAMSLGVPTRALAGDIRAVIRSTPVPNVPKALVQLTNDNTGSWMDTIVDEASGCDVMLVSGLTALVALSAAETVPGLKTVATMMMPITPTHAFPAPLLPLAQPWWLRWFKWFNVLSHRFINWVTWLMLRGSANTARIKHGLSPGGAVFYDYPVLYGVSPSLLPCPVDYPANVFHTGQWIPPRDAWSPPADLVAFLAAGEKPVYVGFGSMAGFDDTVMDVIVGALGDRRAIFAKGWSNVDTASLPPNIFHIDPTPHDWLLPRCAMAIHHGGSGTTHSACAAGIPSIVIPMAGDQRFWAQRLVDLGIADGELCGQKVSPEWLRAAIVFADRRAAQEKAKALGLAMSKEDGVRAAVELIEKMAGR